VALAKPLPAAQVNAVQCMARQQCGGKTAFAKENIKMIALFQLFS